MSRVLLLNASYEPLRILSIKRAIVLVIQEKAEVIEESGQEYRSASAAFPVPRVIRLVKFVKVPYRAKIPLTNRAVLTRDNHECAYCEGRKATTVDHVQPRSRGGLHRWENVVASCSPCNARKADKTLQELGWDCKHKPYAPHGTFWLVLGIRDLDPAWSPYLDPVAVA